LLQGKEANDCVQNIMNNVIQQAYVEQRIYFPCVDHHSFGNFFPLKKKAKEKIKQDAWQDFTYE